MTRDEQITAVSDPAFEAALRTKTRDIVAMLEEQNVKTTDLQFEVNGVPVLIVRGDVVRVDIGDRLPDSSSTGNPIARAYIPRTWLQSTITPPKGS